MRAKIGTAIVLAIMWLKGQAAAGFAKDSRAVSTVEYALIVIAVIAIVGAAAATLSGAFGGLFNDLGNTLTNTVANVTK